jgi:hypothetical protein
MVGFNFYELVHSKDVSMVKTQLFTTVSDSKEEKSDPQKVPLLNELIENSGDLCPGAKRSFLCHMKKGGKPEDKIGMGTKTSLRKSKPDVLLNEGESVLSKYLQYTLTTKFRSENIICMHVFREVASCRLMLSYLNLSTKIKIKVLQSLYFCLEITNCYSDLMKTTPHIKA